MQAQQIQSWYRQIRMPRSWRCGQESNGQNQGTKKNAIKKRRAEVSVLLFCVANYCADIFSARKDFFEKRFELFMQTRHLSFGIEEMLTLDRLSKYWASSLKHELKQTPVSKYFLSSEILLPYNVHIWLTDCARMSILKRSEIPILWNVKTNERYIITAWRNYSYKSERT